MINIRAKSDTLIPKFCTSESACADIIQPDTVVLKPHCPMKLKTGLYLDISPDLKAMIYPRSSTLFNGIIIPVSIIDADYKGEIHVPMLNYTNTNIIVKAGERFAQIEIVPVGERIFTESTTIRSGGFGSTDVK